MFEKYKSLERGEKTKYKRALAEYLDLTFSSVNNFFHWEEIPVKHEEKVKEFNKEYFK